MEISIKTQSIEVSAVSGGGSINIGNTLNMLMRQEVPPSPQPGDQLPPDRGTPTPPPQEGMELQPPPGTPPREGMEAQPPPGTPPREGMEAQPPLGIPPQAPDDPIGQRADKKSDNPTFYPLIPDRTVVGMPFYRLT
ncbi:hypothetical protein [Desmospora activa]|uniref:Uncharacterized protein n=1 Tax=Desmospora activa DSM 45169 TaxID=1121389 RepID=A0A2T4Z3F5_9BACL|nr:hypothetical protein [Desmospora activa]PTM56413.1 hypothetical protein C8J48_2735 [Desmospora activa DSM 45169]